MLLCRSLNKRQKHPLITVIVDAEIILQVYLWHGTGGLTARTSWVCAALHRRSREKVREEGGGISYSGCEEIYVSKKWGFTKYERDEYEDLKNGGRLEQDGCNVKYRPEHGPLNAWKKWQTEIANLS
ncbi:hypothetical protein B566_EDAN006079 [Ephemera danica]|nr:hypothetical protein B566_EDAN006079 [Ephemera danica]